MASYKKSERLCSKTAIDLLFANGRSINLPQLKLIFTVRKEATNIPARMLISVPKRVVKSAVKRNRIKRQLREAYRATKDDFYAALAAENVQLDIAVVYFGKECVTYTSIEEKLKAGLSKVCNALINRT